MQWCASEECYGYSCEALQESGENEAEGSFDGILTIPEVTNLSANRQTILIVEPDSASLRRLEELVRSAGYEVATSSSQAEGFKFVRVAGVDILLLSPALPAIPPSDALPHA